MEIDPEIAREFSEYSDVITFLGAPLWNADGVLNLFIRFAFNLLVAWILVHFGYYRKAKKKSYYFTFLTFSATMFILIFLMDSVKLQIGFTLGLFAIFGMIRYRTETVPVREMTYLFIIIGLAVMNGLSMTISYAELLLANTMVLALVFMLENSHTRLIQRTSKIILYEKIGLIVPEKRPELLADLAVRTGIHNIDEVEIGHIDFLRDVAYIKIYYQLAPGEHNTIGDQVKPR